LITIFLNFRFGFHDEKKYKTRVAKAFVCPSLGINIRTSYRMFSSLHSTYPVQDSLDETQVKTIKAAPVRLAFNY